MVAFYIPAAHAPLKKVSQIGGSPAKGGVSCSVPSKYQEAVPSKGALRFADRGAHTWLDKSGQDLGVDDIEMDEGLMSAGMTSRRRWVGKPGSCVSLGGLKIPPPPVPGMPGLLLLVSIVCIQRCGPLTSAATSCARILVFVTNVFARSHQNMIVQTCVRYPIKI